MADPERKEEPETVSRKENDFCRNFERYEIMSIIGTGTYGDVYMAREKEPKKLPVGSFVTLKKVFVQVPKEKFPQEAIRELNIIVQIDHENILRPIEMCRSTTKAQDGSTTITYYVVSNYCDLDLSQLISNISIIITHAQVKQMMKQLLNGLHFLGINKIFHGSLKPSNILLTNTGILKITDYGLSRAFRKPLEPGSNSFKVDTTLWYRSPELLLEDCNSGPPADIWSAGCIMTEFWARLPLMAGLTNEEQLKFIVNLCGSITPEVWPGVENLPLYNTLKLPTNEVRQIKEILGYYDDLRALDLIDRLLTIDPNQRINADWALHDMYFWEDPMPCDLTELSDIVNNFIHAVKLQDN